MRKIISNIIDENRAKELINGQFNRNDADFTEIQDIIDVIKKDCNIELKSGGKSYWRVEQRPKGHNWHFDTGSNRHRNRWANCDRRN